MLFAVSGGGGGQAFPLHHLSIHPSVFRPVNRRDRGPVWWYPSSRPVSSETSPGQRKGIDATDPLCSPSHLSPYEGVFSY